jgi:N-acetylglucosaminyl-diphospho-decaprenol L-rhamnosyltransferase
LKKPSRVALSVVSHGQTGLVDQLINDLKLLAPESFSILVLTLNLKTEVVPNSFTTYSAGPKVLIRNETTKGFGANHNAAFRKVVSDYCFVGDDCFWVVVNPDIRLPNPATLHRLIDAFTDDVDLVAPEVFENGRRADSARGLYTPLAAFVGLMGMRRNFQNPPDWLAGMFLLIRASCFAKLNGFDERYFMYCEDVDLCLRVQLMNRAIRYVDAVRVEHFAQRASHRSLVGFRRHMLSAVKLWINPVFWRYWFRSKRN